MLSFFPLLMMQAGFVALARLGDLRQHLALFFILYLLLFLCFIVALRQAREGPFLWRWLGWAVLFRLTLLPIFPSLSTDLYRYAWEGRVQAAGFSPYRYSPEAQELSFLRNETYTRLDQRRVSTIYPLLTQWAFRCGDGLSRLYQVCGVSPLRSDVLGQKTVFFFCDLAAWCALLALARARGLPPGATLYYAWNPLVILEFSGSGHNDALGLFFLIAALWLWEARRPLRSAALLGACYLAKYLTVVLLPFLIWNKRYREASIGVGFACAGLLFSWKDFLALREGARYVTHWQFNGFLFSGISLLMGHATQVAKGGVAVLFAFAATWLGRRETDLVRLAFLLISLGLALSPTVHPWYFLWALPFLCLFSVPPLMVWNGTIVTSYWVWAEYARSGIWQLPAWTLGLEYLPVCAALAWPLFRRGSLCARP